MIMFKRIQKRTARRLYNEGEIIYIVPCNVWPDFKGIWIKPMNISKNLEEERAGNLYVAMGFDSIINSYEYYNCNYELGYYTAFYVLEEGVQA